MRRGKIQVKEIAHARSGDKGDSVNIGVIAIDPKDYQILEINLTKQAITKHFEGLCKGEVRRYLMPNIGAINFVIGKALGGGGTASLRIDSQGKTLAALLLKMEITV